MRVIANLVNLFIEEIKNTMQPVFKRHLDERTSSPQMMFFRIRVPHVEEPAMKGYVSCGDTFHGILVFP